MKAQSIWSEAQRYCANTFIVVGIIMTVLGAVQYLLFKRSEASSIAQLIQILLAILIIYLLCERHLKSMFNEDGSKKTL